MLINLYADGTEHAAWHSDDDPWLGRDFDVPSLSLGAARPFRVRRRGGVNETTVTLGHGSLLVMKGAFQREYEHSLPRRPGVGVRINLTWRFVAPALRHLHNLKPRWDSDAPLPERLGRSAVQAATSTTVGGEIGRQRTIELIHWTATKGGTGWSMVVGR